MDEDTTIGGPDVRFQSTLWSVVSAAGEGSREAVERLVAMYWKPVYFFVRRKGYDVETAKDLTQGFFAKAIEKGYVRDFVPERGSFRTFLLASISHYLSNERDHARAVKRGGHAVFVDVETEAEAAGAQATPEETFHRSWAVELLARVMERLREEVAPEDLALLRGEGGEGLTVTTRKSRLHRLRIKLRERILQEIVPTVGGRAEAESELRALFRALG